MHEIKEQKYVLNDKLLEEFVDCDMSIEHPEINEKIASELKKTKNSGVIALLGMHGIGKSTAIGHVREKNADLKKAKWVDFEIWEYPSRNELWSGLVNEFSHELNLKQRWKSIFLFRLKNDRFFLIFLLSFALYTLTVVRNFFLLKSAIIVLLPSIIIRFFLSDFFNFELSLLVSLVTLLAYFLERDSFQWDQRHKKLLKEYLKSVKEKDIYLVIEDFDKKTSEVNEPFIESLANFSKELNKDESFKKKVVFLFLLGDTFFEEDSEKKYCLLERLTLREKAFIKVIEPNWSFAVEEVISNYIIDAKSYIPKKKIPMLINGIWERRGEVVSRNSFSPKYTETIRGLKSLIRETYEIYKKNLELDFVFLFGLYLRYKSKNKDVTLENIRNDKALGALLYSTQKDKASHYKSFQELENMFDKIKIDLEINFSEDSNTFVWDEKEIKHQNTKKNLVLSRNYINAIENNS